MQLSPEQGNDDIQPESSEGTNVRPDRVSAKRDFIHVDERDAWLLYAILHKEHASVTGERTGEGSQAPGATREYLQKLGKWSAGMVHATINRLVAAGYIAKGQYRSAELPKAVEIYEIDTRSCITTRHAAVALLALLEICDEAQRRRRDGHELKGSSDDDPVDQEGRVLISAVVQRAVQKMPEEEEGIVKEILQGETAARSDPEGRCGKALPYPGKIQELVDAGGHLERASHLHVRPRLRLFLEKPYIELVARQPKIEEIKRELDQVKKTRKSSKGGTGEAGAAG